MNEERRQRAFRMATIVLLVVPLASLGCDRSQPELGPKVKPNITIAAGAKSQSPAAQKKVESPAGPPAAPSARVPMGPSPESSVSLHTYNPEGRRDPFRSILVTSDLSVNLENLPALLRTEVGELHLIGIVWGGFGYSAMVQTPDGKGYTIRVGTLVGPNRGTVRKITERTLTVEERYTDIFGENKVREVKLELHPQKEGSE